MLYNQLLNSNYLINRENFIYYERYSNYIKLRQRTTSISSKEVSQTYTKIVPGALFGKFALKV